MSALFGASPAPFSLTFTTRRTWGPLPHDCGAARRFTPLTQPLTLTPVPAASSGCQQRVSSGPANATGRPESVVEQVVQRRKAPTAGGKVWSSWEGRRWGSVAPGQAASLHSRPRTSSILFHSNIIDVILFFITHISRTGRTGKPGVHNQFSTDRRLVEIRDVRTRGQPPGFGHSVLRAGRWRPVDRRSGLHPIEASSTHRHCSLH